MTISVPQTRRLGFARARISPRSAGIAAAVALSAVPLWIVLTEAWERPLPLLAAAALIALSALIGQLRAERRTIHALRAEQQRMTAAAARSTRDLRQSRARIAAGAERERRRIERDLHDGAQQRLVALRIELELAEELVVHDPFGARARLRELEREVDEALDELRALAHGVYPPLLADRGLAEALRAAATRAALPVRVCDDGIGRHATEVESALYFCVLEAVQNACKHAAGARGVTVALGRAPSGGLTVEVSDDGLAVPRIEVGHGILNMRERLTAVDGRVDVAPRAGGGCAVRLHVPAQ